MGVETLIRTGLNFVITLNADIGDLRCNDIRNLASNSSRFFPILIAFQSRDPVCVISELTVAHSLVELIAQRDCPVEKASLCYSFACHVKALHCIITHLSVVMFHASALCSPGVSFLRVLTYGIQVITQLSR